MAARISGAGFSVDFFVDLAAITGISFVTRWLPVGFQAVLMLEFGRLVGEKLRPFASCWGHYGWEGMGTDGE